MDGEQESYVSRRALLRTAPAAAVVAAVAAETGIALANAADPYPALAAAYHRHWNACENSTSDAKSEAEYASWAQACLRLRATHPTTIAGALAAVRVAAHEFREFKLGGDPDRGDILIMTALDKAIVVLERATAHV